MMTSPKSYLILGRLPSSSLFKSIQSKHHITHIPTRGVSRADVVAQISSLPNKSFTFVLVVAESQRVYPIDKTLLGPLKIECLCKNGAGYDSVDVEYFTSRGTWVANAPNAVRIPTAEWCVSLILATVKGLGVVDRNVRQGLWRYDLGLQSNIIGMTLGIVGLGAIGKVNYQSSISDE
jgi:phosphoglycerate dehydrogenase-like enzyme